MSLLFEGWRNTAEIQGAYEKKDTVARFDAGGQPVEHSLSTLRKLDGNCAPAVQQQITEAFKRLPENAYLIPEITPLPCMATRMTLSN